jgi:hypothetical protein
MDIAVIEALIERVVKKSVHEAVSLPSSDNALFPLRDATTVGQLFGVSAWTVRDWHRQKLLLGRYQLVSGRVIKLVFSNRELCRFFDDNFPSLADLHESPFHPKSSRAQRIKKMLAMKRVYNRRRQPKREQL